MKIRHNTIVYFFFFIIAVATFIGSFSFVSIDAWLLPRLLSVIITLLAAAGVITDLIDTKKNPQSTQRHLHFYNKGEGKPLLILCAWLVGLFVCVYLFGFYIAALVFAFLYLLTKKRKLLVCIAFAVIFTGALYLIFKIALSTQLYPGLIFVK